MAKANPAFRKIESFSRLSQELIEKLAEYKTEVDTLQRAFVQEGEQLAGKKVLNLLSSNTDTFIRLLKQINSKHELFNPNLYTFSEEGEKPMQEAIEMDAPTVKKDPTLANNMIKKADERDTNFKITSPTVKEGKYKEISISDLLKESKRPKFVQKTATQLLKENKMFRKLLFEERKPGEAGFGSPVSEIGFDGLDPNLDAVANLDKYGFVISKQPSYEPKGFGVQDMENPLSIKNPIASLEKRIKQADKAGNFALADYLRTELEQEKEKGEQAKRKQNYFKKVGGVIPENLYLIIYEQAPQEYNLTYQNGQSFFDRALLVFRNQIELEGEYNGETILELIQSLAELLETSPRNILIKMFGRGKVPYSRTSVVDTFIKGEPSKLASKPEDPKKREEWERIEAELKREDEEKAKQLAAEKAAKNKAVEESKKRKSKVIAKK